MQGDEVAGGQWQPLTQVCLQDAAAVHSGNTGGHYGYNREERFIFDAKSLRYHQYLTRPECNNNRSGRVHVVWCKILLRFPIVQWCAVGRVWPVGHGQGNWVDIGGGQQPGTSSRGTSAAAGD